MNENSSTAQSWFEIIQYCQDEFPSIQVLKVKKNVIIQVKKE